MDEVTYERWKQYHEEHYQEWCRQHGLDPEDVDTMVSYEGSLAFVVEQVGEADGD